MASLSAKAIEFKPSFNVKAPEFKPSAHVEEEYEEYEEEYDPSSDFASAPINFDDYIRSILQQIPTGYYVKGGKAFNYYFPNQQVETEDWDLIATNEVYQHIYYQMHHLLGHTVILFGYKPKPVNRISERVVSYEDDMNGKKITQTVKTIEINGTGVMDLIIVPEITDAVSMGEDGIMYQERSHFIMDVQQTYRNRVEKSRSLNKKRGKQLSKLERSRRRSQIASLGKKHRQRKSQQRKKGRFSRSHPKKYRRRT